MKRAKPKGKFRSTFEYNFSKYLDRKVSLYGYETEVLEYTPPPQKHKYTPDFILVKKNGELMYLECKGRLTIDDRKKMLVVKDQHPDKDIRFVFQDAKSKIRKGSKTTVSMWAEKNGFKWCEEIIPAQWLKEIKK